MRGARWLGGRDGLSWLKIDADCSEGERLRHEGTLVNVNKMADFVVGITASRSGLRGRGDLLRSGRYGDDILGGNERARGAACVCEGEGNNGCGWQSALPVVVSEEWTRF